MYLSTDEHSEICLFLDIKSLLHFCLSSRASFDAFQSDGMWCMYYRNIAKCEPHLTETQNTYKQLVEEFVTFKFDHLMDFAYKEWIEFSNCNRTIRHTKPDSTKWSTIPTSKRLVPGYIYEWTISIDHLEQVNCNSWLIIVGMESPEFFVTTLQKQNMLGERIARNREKGVGFIVHDKQVMFRDNRISCSEIDTFTDIETVTCIVDMRYSSVQADFDLEESEHNEYPKKPTRPKLLGASMTFKVNGIALNSCKVNNIPGTCFVPCVSLINKQAVSVVDSFRAYQTEQPL